MKFDPFSFSPLFYIVQVIIIYSTEAENKSKRPQGSAYGTNKQAGKKTYLQWKDRCLIASSVFSILFQNKCTRKCVSVFAKKYVINGYLNFNF